MKIIQIAESLSIGDAVANDVVAIDKLLKDMGICGGIYITNENNISDKYLHKIAEPIKKLPKLNSEDIILFHHAIANDFCYRIPSLPCCKVLIYHNITPPEFFLELHKGFYDATKKGLEQIKDLNNDFDFCIADSEFNKQNLIDMGYQCPIYVCPVLIPFEDYEKRSNENIINKYSDDWVNILFVGRVSPNKKQEDIIHAFALYKKYFNSKSRLFLVGSNGIERYGKMLIRYIKQLDVKDVYLTGSVPFADILAYYKIADAFVCMSEHEGFCVPLLEAMYFDVPIIANSSTAIPYTLDRSGIVLQQKDFALAAGWINRLIVDTNLREAVIRGQKTRLNDFKYESIAKQTRNLLKNIIDNYNPPYFKNGIFKNSVKGDFYVLMPIKASDWETAKKTIPFIQKYICPKQIIIASSKELVSKMEESEFINWIDEDQIIPGMTLEHIKKVLLHANGNPKTAGWYFQQFIKLGFSRICQDEYYLVWDADTIPLNNLNFIDTITKKPYFNLKREYVEAYFFTIRNLFQQEKALPESFITEHMFINTTFCKELLDQVEQNDSFEGISFWEKIIYTTDFSLSDQSFSEFETYGTYVTITHPEAYQIRKLRTFRPGLDFLGDCPSEDVLQWVAKEFDTVSFEHWGRPISISVHLCNSKWIRDHFSFSKIVKMVCRWCALKANFSEKQKSFYQQLKLKMEFDYFFDKETVYEKVKR